MTAIKMILMGDTLEMSFHIIIAGLHSNSRLQSRENAIEACHPANHCKRSRSRLTIVEQSHIAALWQVSVQATEEMP